MAAGATARFPSFQYALYLNIQISLIFTPIIWGSLLSEPYEYLHTCCHCHSLPKDNLVPQSIMGMRPVLLQRTNEIITAL